MTTPHPQPERQEVHLKEFDRLRQEIDNRTGLSNQLVLAQLTAFGVGISFLDKLPYVLIGFAAASILLWLLWLDHTEQIYKIAAYIGSVLAPRLSAGGESLLGWEHFLRVLDAGGQPAARLLFGSAGSQGRGVEVHPTRQIGSYIFVLLGGSPIILLVLYSLVLVERFPPTPRDDLYVQVIALGAVFVFWCFAYRQYRLFRRSVMTIDEALAGTGAGAQSTRHP
jgi:hypothetical protein